MPQPEETENLPPLHLDAAAMRGLGYRVIDMLVDHFTQLRDKRVYNFLDRPALKERIPADLPLQPTPVDDVLRHLEHDVFSHVGWTTHPRFFAFVPSPSNFVSAIADALASGYNAFLGNWFEACGPHYIERVTVDWLRQWLGLPDTAGGLFVSGGSMANLTALAAARHAKLSVFTPSSASPAGKGQAASAPTWAGCDLGRAVAYASDQTHSSLEKAFRVLGFAPHQYVRLPTDDSLRLPPEALARRVAADQAAGLRPFCVVATAGTTNAGAVDPLPELAAFCRANDLWLHADGAYGAAAALCEENRKLLQGLELVDSLSIDPHKWLFQPYEIGCVLVRNWEHLFDTFHVSAEYLRDVERASEYVNFQDCGIQLTRGFRALKLWMSLKVFGLEAFKDGIRHGIRLAELTQQVVAQTPRMEVVTPAQLGIVTFRYLPDSAQPAAADEVNKEIVDRLKTDGFAMLTTTAIRGRTVLRMCTIHPGTTEDDIRRTVRRLKELGDAVEAARRKTPQP